MKDPRRARRAATSIGLVTPMLVSIEYALKGKNVCFYVLEPELESETSLISEALKAKYSYEFRRSRKRRMSLEMGVGCCQVSESKEMGCLYN